MTVAKGAGVGLALAGYIDLPAHAGAGGFDHAAIDRARATLYVAHTSNDAVEVVDMASGRHARSIPGLAGVAGALVDEASGFVFTSNRGEDTVGLIAPDSGDRVVKVGVGRRPNGLAYDPERGVLLCANVGDPDVPGSASVTLVDVPARSAIATRPMPGRTRWAIFDPEQRLFFVNIMDPPLIVAVDPAGGDIVRRFPVPARRPHGLDLDVERRRLYCACDDATLVIVGARTGAIDGTLPLSGPPDVVFLNARRSRLYVAVGDPGVIDVVDVAGGLRVQSVTTEPGAHTLAYEPGGDRVYAFLPRTHRAAVFEDHD